MATKWLLVDDPDSRIVYEGNWSSIQNEAIDDFKDYGDFGSPFQNTLHAITEDGGFAFQFSGSAVKVYGTIAVSGSGVSQNPTWQCFVDGNNIGGYGPPPSPKNSWKLCETSNLTNETHTLAVQVIVSNSQTFWLDRIQYVPSASADFSQAFTLIDNLDPSVLYDLSWMPLSDIANMTQTQGGKASLTFNGVSVTWFGFTPNDIPHGSMTGSYTIDGGPSQSFSFSGPGPGITLYNQQYFQTPAQSSGQHTLEVVFGGDNTVLPLTLDYFIIQNSASDPTVNPNQSSGQPTASEPQVTPSTSPFPNASTSPSTSPFPSASTSTSMLSSSAQATDSSRATISPSPVKPAIAGAIGGFFVLVFLGAVIFYVRRRTSKRSEGTRHIHTTKSEATIPYTITRVLTFPRKFAPIRRRPSAISGALTDQINGEPNIQVSSTLVEPTNASKLSVDSHGVRRSSLPSPQHYRHEDSGIRLFQPNPPTKDTSDPLVELPPTYSMA